MLSDHKSCAWRCYAVITFGVRGTGISVAWDSLMVSSADTIIATVTVTVGYYCSVTQAVQL